MKQKQILHFVQDDARQEGLDPGENGRLAGTAEEGAVSARAKGSRERRRER
jgi:hypothetical protein